MAETKGSDQKKSSSNQLKRSRIWGFAGVVICCTLLFFGYWWFFMRDRVSTDNAYVMADSAIVSSRISGTISEVDAENDEFVKEGELLIRLDPQDHAVQVDEHRAALARIEAEIEQAEVSIRLIEARTKAQMEAAQAGLQAAEEKELEARHHVEELGKNLNAAMADLHHAKRDYQRYSNLLKQQAGSEQQRDKAATAYRKARARAEAVEAQIAAAKASLAAILQEVDRARAQLETTEADRLMVEVEKKKLAALKAKRLETEARLKTAELNLSYCTIRAPITGYIAQKRIQVGERIRPGQPLLAIVPLQHVYVEANFKETDLEDVRIGQPAEIEADIYPDYVYYGKVVGIRAGTGAAFSLLPPENATGNWIKVVQRVPVKIRFDRPPPEDYPLRVGLSLEVTIFTEDKSGPRLVKKPQSEPLTHVERP